MEHSVSLARKAMIYDYLTVILVFSAMSIAELPVEAQAKILGRKLLSAILDRSILESK